MHIVKLWLEDASEHFLEINNLSKLEIENMISMLKEYNTIDGEGESYSFLRAQFETGAVDDKLEFHIFLVRLT